MKTYKSIAYAFPTSSTAKHFGQSKTGCYFIQQTVTDCEQPQTCIHPNANDEAALDPREPWLQDLFDEIEDEICPQSMHYHPEYYRD